MIILAKKSLDNNNILVIILVISLSALFSILITQYSLLSITGLGTATTQGTVSDTQGIQVVTTTSSPAGAFNYNTVDFGSVYGGVTMDTTGFISTTSTGPRPIIVRNIGSEPLDVQIQANTLFFTDPATQPTDFQFKVGNPGITGDAGLDTCSTACFTSTGSQTTFANMPFAPTVANAINNLNYQDTNDEARIDIKIHVPTNQQGAVSTTVTIIGTYSNVIP